MRQRLMGEWRCGSKHLRRLPFLEESMTELSLAFNRVGWGASPPSREGRICTFFHKKTFRLAKT